MWSFRPLPAPQVLFHSEVKVFTLSGSHQKYQSHLCESFCLNCCMSLKSLSLILRKGEQEGEREKSHTQTFKAILHKRGNPGLCQVVPCQLQRILSSGQTTSQMLWSGETGEKEEQEGEGCGGWFCCDPFYCFGRDFLLTVWSQGRSARPLRTLAGSGSMQKPHGQDKNERCKERERERKFWHKVILLFSFVLSLSFPGSACSSTSSLILHVSFSLQLQLKPCPSTGPSVHPSVLSPFSLLHPLSRLSLLSDRQSYPPGRFLSAGLPQQRCSVMWNLIFSPPKPNPWPLQSSHNHRGRGAKAGKGGFWEKVKFPKTLLCMHVCVRLCMHDSVHAPDLLCGFFVAGQACVFDSVYKHAWRETSPLYCIVLALKLLYVLASY